jgi:hypothetical protein
VLRRLGLVPFALPSDRIRGSQPHQQRSFMPSRTTASFSRSLIGEQSSFQLCTIHGSARAGNPRSRRGAGWQATVLLALADVPFESAGVVDRLAAAEVCTFGGGHRPPSGLARAHAHTHP